MAGGEVMPRFAIQDVDMVRHELTDFHLEKFDSLAKAEESSTMEVLLNYRAPEVDEGSGLVLCELVLSVDVGMSGEGPYSRCKASMSGTFAAKGEFAADFAKLKTYVLTDGAGELYATLKGCIAFLTAGGAFGPIGLPSLKPSLT